MGDLEVESHKEQFNDVDVLGVGGDSSDWLQLTHLLDRLIYTEFEEAITPCLLSFARQLDQSGNVEEDAEVVVFEEFPLLVLLGSVVFGIVVFVHLQEVLLVLDD